MRNTLTLEAEEVCPHTLFLTFNFSVHQFPHLLEIVWPNDFIFPSIFICSSSKFWISYKGIHWNVNPGLCDSKTLHLFEADFLIKFLLNNSLSLDLTCFFLICKIKGLNLDSISYLFFSSDICCCSYNTWPNQNESNTCKVPNLS